MKRPLTNMHFTGDGWSRLPKRKAFIGCCDCGLVHRAEFKIDGGKLFWRAFREGLLTKSARIQMAAKKRRPRLPQGPKK